jgi:hypothetical protein
LKKIITLYNLLGINQKIQDQHKRIKYLKNVWGLDQITIGECEGLTQPSVSRLLTEANILVPDSNINELKQTSLFQPHEIRWLQSLPREVLSDIQLIAFVENILEIYPLHSFYTNFESGISLRIAALSSLGVQNKCLQAMFNKSQPTISMTAKRNMERMLKMERYNRYEFPGELTFKQIGVNAPQKFYLAGGQM